MTNSEIERFASIQFPPSARDIKTHTETGIDQLMILRFEMDSQDLDAFLQGSHFTQPLREGYRPFSGDYGASLEWWDLERVQQFAGIQDRYSGVYRQMIVDQAEPVLIIYLIAFET